MLRGAVAQTDSLIARIYDAWRQERFTAAYAKLAVRQHTLWNRRVVFRRDAATADRVEWGTHETSVPAWAFPFTRR